jgi:hypothetical protein
MAEDAKILGLHPTSILNAYKCTLNAGDGHMGVITEVGAEFRENV